MLYSGNSYSYTNDVVINPSNRSIVISVGDTKIGRKGGYFRDLTSSDIYVDRALWVKVSDDYGYIPGYTGDVDINNLSKIHIKNGIITNIY